MPAYEKPPATPVDVYSAIDHFIQYDFIRLRAEGMKTPSANEGAMLMKTLR